MTPKSIVLSVLSVSLLIGFVGCSNTNVPVAVADTNIKSVAAIEDLQIMRVASAGSNVWAISTIAQGGYECYTLYKLTSNSPPVWYPTAHWGTELSVSNTTGRCYHISMPPGNQNDRQIWWGTPNSNGQISNPSGGGRLFRIGVAGNADNTDQIWVLHEQSLYSSNLCISTCNSATQQWENMSKNLDVFMGGNYPIRMSVDYIGANHTVVVATVDGTCYKLTTMAGSWELIGGAPSDVMNIAVQGTNIVYMVKYADPYVKIYKGTLDGGATATSVYGKFDALSFDGQWIYYKGINNEAKRIAY